MCSIKIEDCIDVMYRYIVILQVVFCGIIYCLLLVY